MSRFFFVMAGVAIGIVIYLTRKQNKENQNGKHNERKI